ncbi:MAG: hypothetical protein ACM3U2_16900 [Deltaproteobacteria bacterium]
MTNRKKTGAAFWTSVVVAIVYLLSIGPACWLTSRLNADAELVPIVYRPITLFFVGSDHRVSMAGAAIRSYSSIGASPGWGWWRAPADRDVWEWSCSWSYDLRVMVY